MKRLARFFVAMCLLMAVVWGAAFPILAQGMDGMGARYFPGTGHNVQGEFLAFFDRYGGEAIFGLPRTEEFVENGIKVQYFQRARMEYYPANSYPYRVQLTLLGDLLGYHQPPIASFSIPPADHPQRRYYSPTGHTLSYGFLSYFDAHGGLDVFGYPIAELAMENGIVVQYLQRAKMEWHPENALGQQIMLSNLGDEYIVRAGVSSAYLARVAQLTVPVQNAQNSSQLVSGLAVDSGTGGGGGDVPSREVPTPTVPTTPVVPIDLSVSASVKYPITGQGGYQTVYVRAVDAAGQGVAGASVELVVHFRGGDRILTAGDTDILGNNSYTFSIGRQQPGYTVLVEMRVTYAGRMTPGQTSFIVWW